MDFNSRRTRRLYLLFFFRRVRTDIDIFLSSTIFYGYNYTSWVDSVLIQIESSQPKKFVR